jgi:hypothetical protein
MNIAWEWDNDDEFFGEKLPSDTLDRKKIRQISLRNMFS